MSEGSESDPAKRIAELHKRRDDIDREIARALTGDLHEWKRLDAQAVRLDARRGEQQVEVAGIERAIRDNGGDRLDQLAASIHSKEQERDRRKQRAERFAQLVGVLDESAAEDEASFIAQHKPLAYRADTRSSDSRSTTTHARGECPVQ